MTAQQSIQNSNPCLQAESQTLSTGGLVGAMILWGLFLAACDSGMTDVENAVAASPRAGVEALADTGLHVARLDHAVVNQRSTVHDSDLPGAAVAAYGN